MEFFKQIPSKKIELRFFQIWNQEGTNAIFLKDKDALCKELTVNEMNRSGSKRFSSNHNLKFLE